MCPLRFSHARGTTGRDARARRTHVHADRCFQCGRALEGSERVAAHMIVRRCGVPCAGSMVLRTCCRACNHVRHRPRSFWRCGRRGPAMRSAVGANAAAVERRLAAQATGRTSVDATTGTATRSSSPGP